MPVSGYWHPSLNVQNLLHPQAASEHPSPAACSLQSMPSMPQNLKGRKPLFFGTSSLDLYTWWVGSFFMRRRELVLRFLHIWLWLRGCSRHEACIVLLPSDSVPICVFGILLLVDTPQTLSCAMLKNCHLRCSCYHYHDDWCCYLCCEGDDDGDDE